MNIEYILENNDIRYIDYGKNIKIKCINPNHNDKNPSMIIDKKTGLFHCFSCGYSGHISKHFEQIENVFVNNNKEEEKKVKEYPTPLTFGNVYNIFDNPQVLNFVHKIGFSDDFIKEKQISYCLYNEMIADNLYSVEEQFTAIINRIIIPIYHNKKLINYECRTFCNDIPKVKYVKGCSSQTIYNYDNIDPSKMVYIVESIKNLAKVWQIDKNVVSLFHNLLTDQQTEMINNCPNVCLLLDNDNGGKGKYNKNKECILDGMLQSFTKRYKGNIYIACDNRTYFEQGKFKGFDMNDCSLLEIEKHIKQKQLYKGEQKL